MKNETCLLVLGVAVEAVAQRPPVLAVAPVDVLAEVAQQHAPEQLHLRLVQHLLRARAQVVGPLGADRRLLVSVGAIENLQISKIICVSS